MKFIGIPDKKIFPCEKPDLSSFFLKMSKPAKNA